MREQIFKQITQISGTIVYDPTNVDFSKFKYTNGYYNHTLAKREIEKPYLISLAYYGTVDYDDIILLVNNIANIWECAPGVQLKIPKLDDLKTFLLGYQS